MASTAIPLRPPAPAVATAAVADRAASKADLLCWAVCALGLVNVWRIQALYPVLAPLRLGMVFIAVGLFAWFQASDEPRRWARIYALGHTRLVLLLFGVMLAGVPLGVYPGNALKFIQNVYIGTLLYFLFTVASIRSKRDVERLLLVHLAGALIFTLFVLSRFEVGPSGRLSRLPTYDANDAAMLMVCAMPLAVYFLRKGVAGWLRVVMIIGFGAFVVLLVRSGSRGGFIGFIATMTYLLFRFRAITFRIRAAALVVGVGTIVLAGTERYWEMMRTLLSIKEDYNYTSEGGRKEIWKRGIGYMLRYPVVGVGGNNFGAAEATAEHNRAREAEGKGWIWAAPHNSFVQAGAETGVTGLALFLAMLVLAFRYTLKRPPPRAPGAVQEEWALRMALAGSLIAYCVAGFFLSQAYSPLLYSLLGMVAGLMKVRASEARGIGLRAAGAGPAALSRRRGQPR